MAAHTALTRTGLFRNRWVQLLAGIVGMVAVTNFQYAWTFFVDPLAAKYTWSRSAIQWGFTIFILTETWLVPVEAYLADRFGSRPMVFLGGILAGLGWVVNSRADTLLLIYTGSALAGMGAGIVYGISIGSSLRWFPDRRGLAAGLTSAAFGAGSALTVVPIERTIKTLGYEAAFFWFGIGQGAVVLLTALVLRDPPADLAATAGSVKVEQSRRDYRPLEMLQLPVFWVMYLLMTMVTMGGLMAIAQLAPMARSLKIPAPGMPQEVVAATAVGLAAAPADVRALAAASGILAGTSRVADYPFHLFGYALSALALAAGLERILNGLTRPFFGWISDHVGREPTMFVAFLLEGCAILLLISFAHVPLLFVLFSGLTLFAWGEIYSLFPALCGDTFGRRYATTNYALLYTAKGTAALMVPLGSYLHRTTGSWLPIFLIAVAFDWIVAFLVLFLLRPMRQRVTAK